MFILQLFIKPIISYKLVSLKTQIETNSSTDKPLEIETLFNPNENIFFVSLKKDFETKFKLSKSQVKEKFIFKSSFSHNNEQIQNVNEQFKTYKYPWGILFLIDELELLSKDKVQIKEAMENLIKNIINISKKENSKEVWVPLDFLEDLFRQVGIEDNPKDWLEEKFGDEVSNLKTYTK